VSGLRTRRRPTGRRAMIIAVLLSLLLPGLGHAYAMRFVRALIWFGGTVAIGLVLGGGEENRNLALAMGGVIAVLAAADIALLMWLESRAGGGRTRG
jgi:hypothetical protein